MISPSFLKTQTFSVINDGLSEICLIYTAIEVVGVHFAGRLSLPKRQLIKVLFPVSVCPAKDILGFRNPSIHISICEIILFTSFLLKKFAPSLTYCRRLSFADLDGLQVYEGLYSSVAFPLLVANSLQISSGGKSVYPVISANSLSVIFCLPSINSSSLSKDISTFEENSSFVSPI